jgi:hypothetical protein
VSLERCSTRTERQCGTEAAPLQSSLALGNRALEQFGSGAVRIWTGEIDGHRGSQVVRQEGQGSSEEVGQ